MEKMKDIDIRKPLIEKIIRQNKSHNYRIIPEMSICDGFSRVDIAVANGKLCGYEIKSDADTLDRLPQQQEFYNKTFDKMYIVVGPKYQSIIETLVPDWWGIYVANYNKSGNIYFKQIRKAHVNKNISAEALLELLWKDEISTLLKNNQIKGISSKNRRMLRKIAIENLSLRKIKEYTRETLKLREDWR